jgi:hypothetical protein
MNADELRALQVPVKACFKDDPASAVAVLRAAPHFPGNCLRPSLRLS